MNVSASASQVYSTQYMETYVDWGDGTGLHLGTLQGTAGYTATVSAKLDAAGDPGQSNATLTLYGINEPDNHSAVESGRGFRVDVAGITINNLPQDQKQSPGATLVTDPGDPAASFEPVTLTIPDALPVGTIVKLSINDSAMSEAQVLQGPTPDESDAVILGGTADDAADTITWTKGSGTTPWQNLWIEPLEGNDSEADVVLSLEVDAPTTQTTPPATGQAKDDADAKKYAPRILYTPDQANATAVDITNKVDNDPSTAILPGQLINLKIDGDGGAATDFSWSFEGNIFKDYATTDVVSDKTKPNYGASTGSINWDVDRSSRSTSYYYEPSDATTSVMLNCTFKINGEVYTVEAGFKLYEPTSTFSLKEGSVGPYGPGPGTPKWVFGIHGNSARNGTKAGMTFSGSADTSALPAPLNQGNKVFMTQLMKDQSFHTLADTTHTLQKRVVNGIRVVDTNVHYGGMTGVADGRLQTWVDSPFTTLGLPGNWDVTWATRFDVFNDYLMFVPTGQNSRPVALRTIQFGWGGGVYYGGNDKWIYDPKHYPYRDPMQDTVPSDLATGQPTWDTSDLRIQDFINVQ